MTKEEFIALQQELQASGKPLMSYLQEAGVSYSTYTYWRRKLEHASRPEPEMAPISLRQSSPDQTFTSAVPSGATLLFPNGDVFIFIGSSRRLMKLLHAEDGGMVMYVKRLEAGRFKLPEYDEDTKNYPMEWRDLVLMVEGIQESPEGRLRHLRDHKKEIDTLRARIKELTAQVAWLNRQLYGRKSTWQSSARCWQPARRTMSIHACTSTVSLPTCPIRRTPHARNSSRCCPTDGNSDTRKP